MLVVPPNEDQYTSEKDAEEPDDEDKSENEFEEEKTPMLQK